MSSLTMNQPNPVLNTQELVSRNSDRGSHRKFEVWAFWLTTGVRGGGGFLPDTFAFVGWGIWVVRTTLTSSHPPRDPTPMSMKLGSLLLLPASTVVVQAPGPPLNGNRGKVGKEAPKKGGDRRTCIVSSPFAPKFKLDGNRESSSKRKTRDWTIEHSSCHLLPHPGARSSTGTARQWWTTKVAPRKRERRRWSVERVAL